MARTLGCTTSPMCCVETDCRLERCGERGTRGVFALPQPLKHIKMNTKAEVLPPKSHRFQQGKKCGLELQVK